MVSVVDKKGFNRYIEQIEAFIKENEISVLDVSEASMILDLSPNYTRSVLKALARKNGWVYKRGKLYISYLG